MSEANPSPGAMLMARWQRLSPFPGGRRMFTKEVGRMAPYSGSIDATVLELEPGHCRVQLTDRPEVRNHLGSIHAVALTNLGEMASGLAMLTRLDDTLRAIAIRLDSAYLKKARGTLLAECHCDLPTVTGPVDQQIVAEIRDVDEESVARITATWRLDLAR